MTHEQWRQSWLTMWGMVGLAHISLDSRKTNKKRQTKKAARITPKVFLETLEKHCPTKVIYGPHYSKSFFGVLAAKLISMQLDEQAVGIIGKYISSKETSWLRSPLHVANVVNKLEVWHGRAVIWEKNRQKDEFEDGLAGRKR